MESSSTHQHQSQLLTAPPADFRLSEEEAVFFRQADQLFSFLTPRAFFEKIKTDDPADPVRRQIVPTAAELLIRDYEKADPLAEGRFSPVPRLVHRYPDRCIIKVTDACAVHCRFCFRRSLLNDKAGVISGRELSGTVGYLAAHPEIAQVLLTGGDPLTIESGRLEKICAAVKKARPDIVLRIGTRIPVVLPGRITRRLAATLASFSPLWMSIHCNHPDELSGETAAALAALAEAGIPLAGQTVLLSGINDNVDTLAGLFQRLISLGVKPYYLFSLDPAPGTSHFRVPLEQGLGIMRILRERFPRLALPVYALDLPDGGGKIPVERLLIKADGDRYLLTDPSGGEYRYPKE